MGDGWCTNIVRHTNYGGIQCWRNAKEMAATGTGWYSRCRFSTTAELALPFYYVCTYIDFT